MGKKEKVGVAIADDKLVAHVEKEVSKQAKERASERAHKPDYEAATVAAKLTGAAVAEHARAAGAAVEAMNKGDNKKAAAAVREMAAAHAAAEPLMVVDPKAGLAANTDKLLEAAGKDGQRIAAEEAKAAEPEATEPQPDGFQSEEDVQADCVTLLESMGFKQPEQFAELSEEPRLGEGCYFLTSRARSRVQTFSLPSLIVSFAFVNKTLLIIPKKAHRPKYSAEERIMLDRGMAYAVQSANELAEIVQRMRKDWFKGAKPGAVPQAPVAS